MKATVLMLAVTSMSVQVDIPDDTPEDERYAAAVDAAYENAPPGLCFHCAGYDRPWGRDEGQPDVPEPGQAWPPHRSTFTDAEIVTFDD